MANCACCGAQLDDRGSCVFCDVTLSSPPHACLRTLEVVTDEHGCPPAFDGLPGDHETEWRTNQQAAN